MEFFHSYRKIGSVLEIRRVYKEAISAPCSGTITLSGSLVKNYVANAKLMLNGADFAVYFHTANEVDL